MTVPEISIIIPVCNAEHYLPKCLNSVLGQTFKNIEVICINDGSTDRSAEILQRFSTKDNRIRVVHQKNGGVSSARNTALHYVKGKYILFLDSDDWIDHGTCETAFRTIQEHRADVVFWSYIREFKDDSKPKMIYKEECIVFEDETKKSLQRRFIGLYGEELSQPENADAVGTVWGKLYKSTLIIENKLTFESLEEIGTSEDAYFNLKVFNYVDKAVYINRYFNHYRKDNETSETAVYNKELFVQWNALFDLMEKYIEEQRLGEECFSALENRIALGLIGLGLRTMKSNLPKREQVRELQQILSSERYRMAFSQLTLEYFPIHWKLFFLFAKWNFTAGIFVLLVFMQRMRG